MPKLLSWRLSGRSWLKMGSLIIFCAVLAACSSAAAPTQPVATSPAADSAQPAAIGSAQPVAASSAADTAGPTAMPPAAEATDPAATNVAPETPESTASTAGSTSDQPAAEVTLEIGTAAGATDFRYDKTTLEAPAGSKITLKFTNNTKLSDEVGHNWVLVKPGQEASVLANAQAAGDNNDWLQDGDPGIIAHTALIEGESSDTITFDAPAPGTYTFLSTFPNQYEGGMKGTLTIK